MLKSLTLCICLTNALVLGFAAQAFGWIKVYEKNGVIYIQGSGEKRFKRPKNVKTIREKIVMYAKKYGIPERLFLELVRAESNFNPKAVSPKGAMGLCQLMPQTAKMLGVKDPFNVDENLNAGAYYLKKLYNKYGDWKLALAAYNAGEGSVNKYGTIPPYRETRNYVKKIITRFKAAGGELTKKKPVKKKKRTKIVMKEQGDTILIYSVGE